MKFVLMALLIVSASAFAEMDDKIFIKGKVGAEFNDQQVKITDSLGQTYFLSRKAFPDEFEFKQGKEFNLEVAEKYMAEIKLIKKK